MPRPRYDTPIYDEDEASEAIAVRVFTASGGVYSARVGVDPKHPGRPAVWVGGYLFRPSDEIHGERIIGVKSQERLGQDLAALFNRESRSYYEKE